MMKQEAKAKITLCCCLLGAVLVHSVGQALTAMVAVRHFAHIGTSGRAGSTRFTDSILKKLPMNFEINRGQADQQVEFFARGTSYSLSLTQIDAVLALGSPRVQEEIGGSKELATATVTGTVLRMKLVGAKAKKRPKGFLRLPGLINYFIGRDPQGWHTGIPTYAKVRYASVYPGIDLIYYGCQGQLEYDLLIAHGANPRAVTLSFEGADKIELDDAGNLVLHIAGGEILQRKPNVYQTMNGARKSIEGKYVVKGTNQIGFEIAAYDRSKPLVIDPVLVYSTFLSGSGADEGDGITVDSAKNTYITGVTNSLNFPTTAGAFQTAQGSSDVFVTKLNAAGTAVLYSTYFGGSGNDEGTSIKVDEAGNAYVTGSTDSPNFPTTTGAFQTSLGGGSDAFIAKLNPTGSALVYSTYLGGSNDDEAFGLATDLSGNAYVTGVTDSSNFPTTTGAYQTVAGGGGDAFVARLNPTGTTLDYSTYLGGNSIDWGFCITTDLAGNAYVAGTTYSANSPVTAGAYQSSYGGNGDAFVAKLNPAGSALSYSTYLGGSSIDSGFAITYGLGGVVYLTGVTDSPNFPTSLGALQTVRGGSSDAFVTKVNTSLAGPASLVYSTYLGGSSVDWGFGLTTDLAGNAYVTGASHSANFPVTVGTYQSTSGGGSDAFVAKLNPTGTALVYSTYVGGGNNDAALGNASDPAGNAYVTGVTDSSNFPTTTGAFQTNSGGGSDAFVTKVAIPDPGLQINLIDDARTFVTQHYLDFLSREPDQGGLDYWTGQITQCANDAICIHNKRVDVSNAFFYELEFQQTGSYVYRLYRAAFGNNQPFPNPDGSNSIEAHKLPNYLVFAQDRARVVGGADLAQGQLSLANAFVQRSGFLAKYPTNQDGPTFVDAILATIKNDMGVDLGSQRTTLINLFNTSGRGAVLYRLADDNVQTNPLDNRAFIDEEYNRSFVYTQYAGYLRRDSDIGGFLFWLGQVSSGPVRDTGKQHAMVCSFITSAEYQQRFSPVVTHTNQECPR